MTQGKPIPDHVVESMHNLIWHYIQKRLKTVVPALIELRPDIIVQLELQDYLNADIENLSKKMPDIQRQLDIGTFQWTGIWNDKWAYRLHGLGCELVHLETNERFDWDANDPYIFFTGEFGMHLHWRMKTETDDIHVKRFHEWLATDNLKLQQMRGWLRPILIRLVERKSLATRNDDEWKLLKQP